MARAPSFAQTEPAFRPLATAARKMAVGGRSCANCGSPEIRPSNHRNALDILLACAFLAPFRCQVCRVRFYRVWRPSLQRPPGPPIAPLLMMFPRRKLPNVDSIERRRIQPEPVQPQNKEPQLAPPHPTEVDVAAVDVMEPEPMENALAEPESPEAKP